MKVRLPRFPGRVVKDACPDRRQRAWILSGHVRDHKKAQCPKDDVIFLSFYRKGERERVVYLRPDEADVVLMILSSTLVAWRQRHA